MMCFTLLLSCVRVYQPRTESLKCAQNSWLRIETLILRFMVVTKMQDIGNEKELCVSSDFCLSL